MIHNWITNVNRELYQLRGRPDHFISPIPNAFSPPESCCDETSHTDIVTPPPTPCGWVEYPTPPPSRNDAFYPHQQSPQEAYANYKFTDSITKKADTKGVQLPECLDFILDHPFAGPQFETVDEARAFLLGSLEEFYSTGDPKQEHPQFMPPLNRSQAVSNDSCPQLKSQMYPLSVSPADSQQTFDDDSPMSPPQHPKFETLNDAKEYILNAVEEFYSRASPDQTELSDTSRGSCSTIPEETACYQLTTQYLVNAGNFIQEPIDSNPWR